MWTKVIKNFSLELYFDFRQQIGLSLTSKVLRPDPRNLGLLFLCQVRTR